MQLQYDDDARFFAEQVAVQLRVAGYFAQMDSIAVRLRRLEGAITDIGSATRHLLQANNIQGAFRFLFSDAASSNRLRRHVAQQLNAWETDPSGQAESVKSALVEAAIIVDSGSYVLPVPLNVIASIEVLFRLLVIPQRCFRDASSILNDTLLVDLHIVDDEGRSWYGPDEQRRAIESEVHFWALLDTIIRQWPILSDADPALEITTDEGVESYLYAHALRIAAQSIAAIQSARANI